MDLTLAPTEAADTPPFVWIDMGPLAGALAALPTVLGTEIANRIWFEGGFSFFALSALVVGASNSDIRGGVPSNLRNQVVVSMPFAAAVFTNPKRLQDVSLEAGFSAGGFISLPGGGELYMENVTITAPGNGFPGPSPLDATAGNRLVLERCELFAPGILISPLGNAIQVEDDNFLGTGGLADAGGSVAFLIIKGTGNTILASVMPAGTLDVDIGHSGFFDPKFSGADSMTYGCGAATLVPAAPIQLYPGGGNAGDAAPFAFPAVGGEVFGANSFRGGIARGIFIMAEAPSVGAAVDITVYQGGIPLFTELAVPLLPGGTFVSTTFGFLDSGVAANEMVVELVEAASGTSWTSLNCSVLVK